MGYILLGHGGLNVDPSVTPKDMEFVAIPSGTTIQFYADAGQGLAYNSTQLDIFAQLQAPWPALDSTRVTYNLALHNAQELWGEELKNSPDFAGHTLIRAGVDGVPDPIRMCTGTRATCPTDPRRIAAGDTHKCDGILARYTGDLYWLACSSIIRADRSVVSAAKGGTSDSVVLGADPDWIPGDSDFDAVAEVNKANVKATDDGDQIAVTVGGFIALIGTGHDQTYLNYAYLQADKAQGTITVNKGGMLSGAGSLDVSGIPPVKQGVVQAAIERFSDKTVNFA